MLKILILVRHFFDIEFQDLIHFKTYYFIKLHPSSSLPLYEKNYPITSYNYPII